MGMYSTVEENENLMISDKLEAWDELNYEDLYNFLSGNVEYKFFGYFNEEMLKKLDEIGKKNLVKGECIIRYEEGDIIKCVWDSNGFNFKIGRNSFDDEWFR